MWRSLTRRPRLPALPPRPPHGAAGGLRPAAPAGTERLRREFGWWTGADGSVTGALLRTPPHNLLLTELPTQAPAPLVDLYAAADPALPGVIGPVATAESFGAAWQRATGAQPTMARSQRLYRLAELAPPTPAKGQGGRVAGPGDRAPGRLVDPVRSGDRRAPAVPRGPRRRRPAQLRRGVAVAGRRTAGLTGRGHPSGGGRGADRSGVHARAVARARLRVLYGTSPSCASRRDQPPGAIRESITRHSR
jgi:hypothetical protein